MSRISAQTFCTYCATLLSIVLLAGCSYFETGAQPLSAHSRDLPQNFEAHAAPIRHDASGEFPEFSEIIHAETRGAVKIYPLD